MQETQTEYTIVRGTATDDELEKYRLCFQENGTEREMSNLQWLHKKNLLGSNVIWYAMYGTKVAGIATAIPFLFNINGSPTPALHSIDLLTDIDHRGKRLFLKLYHKLDDDAKNKFAFIFGFPNDNSAPSFFNKLEWKSFGEIPFLVKPIGIAYFLKKLLNRKKHSDFSSTNHIFEAPSSQQVNKNSIIREINSFGSDYDEIWSKLAKTIRVCIDRRSDFMNWRYFEKPNEHYYRYGLYTDDKLAGIVVFALKNKHNGLIGYIMELIFDPENTEAGKWMLNFASKQFKKQKADVVLAWSRPGSFNHRCYKKSGYFTLPEKLRPQKLFMGVKAYDRSRASLIEDFKNWYISYSDSDTV